MHVVAWYLPTFEDVDADLLRLTESAALDVGGLAVDIESTAIADVAERNRRLLDLSTRLRAALGPTRRSPPYAVGGAPPGGEHGLLARVAVDGARGHLRRRAPDELLDHPQGRPAQQAWPKAAQEHRTRASLGDPDVPIVPVGGLAEDSTAADLEGMVAAIEAGEAGGRWPLRLGDVDP